MTKRRPEARPAATAATPPRGTGDARPASSPGPAPTVGAAGTAPTAGTVPAAVDTSPAAGGRDSRSASLFVDAVEGGVARLLDDGVTFSLPARLLPPGVGEGDWVDVAIAPVAAPPDARAADRLRERLAKDDPDGDITL